MLKAAAVILIVLGAAVNYSAGYIVKCLSLDRRIDAGEAGEELYGEDLEKYRHVKALSLVKLVGFLILIPGAVLAFIAFR